MRPFKELKNDPNHPESTDPDDYAFIGAADMHPGHEWVEVRHDQLARFGVETGSSSPHSTVNVPFYDTEEGRWLARCHFCGSTREGGLKSNIFYFCFYLHKPSKVAICVGQDCARKYNLGEKHEREFQGRRDEYFRREKERTRIETAKSFLKHYHEWLQRGGDFFNPFLASLWDQLQERGTLSDKQLNALDKWIYRADGSPKEQAWTKPEQRIDADRHKTEVTHTDEDPTDAQRDYIGRLAKELGEDAPHPQTRAEAATAINELKGRVLQRRYRQERSFITDERRQEENNRPATSKQLAFIHSLMDQREIALAERQKARQMLDDGLSSAQASRWITKLQELPFIE